MNTEGMIQQAPIIGVELLLSGPLSWPQPVRQRLLAVVLAAAVAQRSPKTT
jgi:hypothetical protein